MKPIVWRVQGAISHVVDIGLVEPWKRKSREPPRVVSFRENFLDSDRAEACAVPLDSHPEVHG